MQRVSSPRKMTEEQSKKVESESASNPPPPPASSTTETSSTLSPPPPSPPPKPEHAVHEEAPKEDVAEEKSVIPQPSPQDNKPLADDPKALVLAEKTPEAAEEKPLEGSFNRETPKAAEEKPHEGSVNRDAVLTRVATDKRLSLIKAWEESEKSKAENKAHRKISSVLAWENSKKAAREAELRKMEEQLEKTKAEYAEKLKNKIAMVHKEAEEKRAMIEAKKGEDFLKAEEKAAKYRATGTAPKKLFGWF